MLSRQQIGQYLSNNCCNIRHGSNKDNTSEKIKKAITLAVYSKNSLAP